MKLNQIKSFETFLAERNDRIDNEIHSLVQTLASTQVNGSADIDWDMAYIGEIGDAVVSVMEAHGIPTCHPFYEGDDGEVPCYLGADCDNQHCMFRNNNAKDSGRIITLGKDQNGEPITWKAVHETEDNITYMEMHGSIKPEDLLFTSIFTNEERSLIVPTENDELLWLPSVKQLGFTPAKPDEKRGWNEIPEARVSDKVWEEETFHYFSDPCIAPSRRNEFGKHYQTSTSFVGGPYGVWYVNSDGSAYYINRAYNSREVRPCITLKKGR